MARIRLGFSGRNCRLGPNFYISPYESFFIGDNFFSGPNGYFTGNNRCKVTIGKKVMFGPFVKIVAGNHNMVDLSCHSMDAPIANADKGIHIEDGVWVGSSAILLDGAHLGEGCVIGAGAVVTGYIPPYAIAVGVPARVIRCRFNSHDLEVMLCNVASKYTMNSVFEMYPSTVLVGAK